jgi:hypothetical protein
MTFSRGAATAYLPAVFSSHGDLPSAPALGCERLPSDALLRHGTLTGDEIAGLTGTPCAELEAPGRWAPGSSVTCPVGAKCHQRASVSAASSFCFMLPRQVHDICRHMFAAQGFRRDHSAPSAA